MVLLVSEFDPDFQYLFLLLHLLFNQLSYILSRVANLIIDEGSVYCLGNSL